MGPTAQIIAVFGIVKTIHLLVLLLLPIQFDVSSPVLLYSYDFEKDLLCNINTPYAAATKFLRLVSRMLLDRVIDKLVVWDAVYFSNLFVNGTRYEHEFVFCPLWWRFIGLVPEYKGMVFYPRLIVATVVANLCHLAAALMLYRLTLAVFENARIFSPSRMALCLLVLYIMSPAAAFMTAPYSEPAAAFVSFTCFYLRQLGLGASPIVIEKQTLLEKENGLLGPQKISLRAQSLSPDPEKVTNFRNEISNQTSISRNATNVGQISTSLGFNAVLRINSSPKFAASPPRSFRLGLYLLSGVLAAFSYGFRANCLLIGIVYVSDLFTIRPFPAFSPIIAGLMLFFAFFLTHYHNYAAICMGSDRGEWCNNRIPLLFTYAQAHYWNNGLFKYWTPNNIPNFLFGAPIIVLSLTSIRYFREVYPVDRVFPILVVNAVFIVLLLLLWHVQIVTRIHLFLPIIYWVVAGLLTQPNSTHRRWGRICVGYFVFWGVLQVSLFAAFLPPA